MDACAVLLAQDGTTETGKVSCLSVSDDSVSLKYTPNSASAAAPAFLLVGKRNPPDHRYSIPSENVQTFKQAITGDFCQKDENCNCTTAMLKPEAAPGNQCASFPRGRSVADWERRGRRRLSATVSDASGAFHSATVESLDADTAVVTFTAPTDFKPASMLLTMRGDGANPGGAYSFAYAPQQPLQVSNLNYAADNLSSVCDLYSIPLNPAATQTCGGGSCTVTLQTPYLGAEGDKIIVANAGQELDCDSCEVTAINSSTISYTSRGNFSGTVAGGSVASPTLDCANTKPEHLQLKPLTVGADVSFVALTDQLLVARVKAPMGLEPTALIVTNTNACGAQPPKTCSFPPRSTVVRRTIKPGQNNDLLQVDMTIMDQITAQRNYGNRIAKRYIAVTLDVKNPTAKKLQFNKSAIYFDVDFVEAEERPKGFADWVLTPIAEGSTLGMYQRSVYSPPFIKGRKDGKPPRVSRFGLEQNVRYSPVNYLSVLGSFDYTTTLTDDKLKAVELLGALLGNIATGGLVSDASGAFRAGTSVFSGTFLPGVRGLVLDTSFINRLRSNLVAQTLQDAVQVPAGSSISTIVLLPRMGILDFTDAEVPVMVDRVIDVHLDEEVLTPVGETPVQKGACKAGYTKDQAREALGEPSGVTTAADKSSTFTFDHGPVASASFDAKGALQSCKTRSASEQLDQATTQAEALQSLTDLGLSSTKLELTDGSTILVDIPGVQTVYRFDSKGAKMRTTRCCLTRSRQRKASPRINSRNFWRVRPNRWRLTVSQRSRRRAKPRLAKLSMRCATRVRI